MKFDFLKEFFNDEILNDTETDLYYKTNNDIDDDESLTEYLVFLLNYRIKKF